MTVKNKNINKEKGAAMLIAVIFFLFASVTIILGMASPILKQVVVSKNITTSKNSYYLSEGAVEEILYRLISNKQVSSSETLSLNNGNTTTLVTNTAGGKQIVSTGNVDNLVRKVQTTTTFGTGISFHYGVQSGQGGFQLKNSSSIIGNVFSEGSVTGSGNMIYGDVVSTGASGLFDGIHATGTAYAHNIRETSASQTIIDKDAYYVNKDAGVTVNGNSHPNSPDQASVSLPISDAQITEWENDAASGGSVTCSGQTYVISSNTTIGPKKIPCDLEISGSPTVTITGFIWVTGNITTKNSPTIKMSSSLGSQNVAIIADNPTNRSGSGIITIANSTAFQNSGSTGSFVFMISQNNSAESGGSTDAISLSNSASALVAYASHGLITLSNNISLKEVTAYKIVLQNSANVTYDTGLPSTVFSAGPSGGYTVTDWREIQ